MVKDRTEKIINFTTTAARYLCLQSLNSQNNDAWTTLAELKVLNQNGDTIPRAKMRVLSVDCQQTFSEDGRALNVLDGKTTTYWHTQYSGSSVPYPHYIVIDLGAEYRVSGCKFLPRQNSDNGMIKNYNIYF